MHAPVHSDNFISNIKNLGFSCCTSVNKILNNNDFVLNDNAQTNSSLRHSSTN